MEMPLRTGTILSAIPFIQATWAYGSSSSEGPQGWAEETEISERFRQKANTLPTASVLN